MPTSSVVAESRRRPRSVETRIFFRIGTVLWGSTAPLTIERPRARSSCLHFSLREAMSELESVTGFGNPTVVIEAMSFLNSRRQGVPWLQPRGGIGAYFTHIWLDISCENLYICPMKQVITAKLKLHTDISQ